MKVINFTGSIIENTISSIIHPMSRVCNKAEKVIFKDEDKNCDLCKAYKEAGIKVEIKKTTKAPVKKAKK
jgi:hypothetical protein